MIAMSHEPAPGPRVAYKGVPGAFGEEAIARHWRGQAIAVPTTSFDAAITAVISGVVDYGVIPTWNSSIGNIGSARAALDAADGGVEIVAAIEIPVRHSLWAVHRGQLSDLRAVASHPAALDQCRGFFRANPWIAPCDAFDTASAARDLRDAGASWMIRAGVESAACAAIASKSAGARYRLNLIAEDIQDDPGNRTRFAVIRWQRWWHG